MVARADLVRMHGADPISFSTLQPGLRYCETSYGYIAYQRAWGIDITLGPPVAAAADQAALIDRFLRTAKRPVFCYLRAQDAARVAQTAASSMGPQTLYTARMGSDRLLSTHAVQAPDHALPKPLLGARKHARRAGFSMQRIEANDLTPPLLDRLAQITACYLQKSQLPYEMRFLNRPFDPNDMRAAAAGSRTYLLRQQQAGSDPPLLFGYAVLNPWFHSDGVAGYLLDIFRCQPTRQWGVFYAVVDALCHELHREGILYLSLGFCPLHCASDSSAACAPGTDTAVSCSSLLSAQIAWLEQHLAEVPYVQRLRELKTALPGISQPRYFVSHSPLALPAFVALMGACGVRLRSLMGPSLWQSIAAARARSR